MTLQKAIKIIDLLIEQETKLAKGMVDSAKPWNQGFDCVQFLAKSIAENMQSEIIALQKVRSNIIPKCNHPKQMRDRDSNGNLYCMDCNCDL
ncbi:MAG: hypothetical protein ACW9XH_06845 [Candidatus Nitrosopumilus sp. bin_32a]